MMPRKFNFIPISQFHDEPKQNDFVNVNLKTGKVTFSTSYVLSKGLEDSSLKFYYDSEKKALAWKVAKRAETSFEALKDTFKVMTVNRRGGKKGYTLSLRKCFKTMGIIEARKLKELPIKTYAKAHFGEDLDYVRLSAETTNDEE